jgi:hypothetical protein
MTSRSRLSWGSRATPLYLTVPYWGEALLPLHTYCTLARRCRSVVNLFFLVVSVT